MLEGHTASVLSEARVYRLPPLNPGGLQVWPEDPHMILGVAWGLEPQPWAFVLRS